MMRCKLCAKLNVKSLDDDDVEFHSNLLSLKLSAESGCDFCNLCWRRIKFDWPKTYIDAMLQGRPPPDTPTEPPWESQLWLRGQFLDRTAFTQPGSSQTQTCIWLSCGKLFDRENVAMELSTELRLFAVPGTTAASIFIGRMSTHDRDPQLALEMAKTWLNRCRDGVAPSGHKTCNTDIRDEMPTRVIDLGSEADVPDGPRLIVTNGLREQYLAFSYCWGPSATKYPKLTRSNLTSLTDSISEENLSGAHKDMFRVARELGVRYVWIDALCIIQDDLEDWEYESRRMGQVYGNSLMTVIAGRSGDSSQGFIENDLDQEPPCPLPLEEGGEGVDSSGLFACFPRSKEMGPASARAWCFQEMHLSRRSLIFGATQLYFRCREHLYSEDGYGGKLPTEGIGTMITARPSATVVKSTRTSALHVDLDRRDQALSEWYTLLMEYTMRQLSNPYDVFAALSSIAQLAGHTLQSRYLCGLWEADLVRGLLWKSRRQVHKGGSFFFPDVGRWPPVKRPEPTYLAPGPIRRAPSWSWAAVQGPTLQVYRVSNRLKADKVVVRPRSTDPDRWTTDQGHGADVLNMPSCELQIIGCLKAVKVLESKKVDDYKPRGRFSWAYNKTLLCKYGVLLAPLSEDFSNQVGVDAADAADPLSNVVAIGVFDIAHEQVAHVWCLRLTEDEGLMLVPAGEGRHVRAGWFIVGTEENRKWFEQDNEEVEVLLV